MRRRLFTKFNIGRLHNEEVFDFMSLVDNNFNGVGVSQLDEIQMTFHDTLMLYQQQLEPVRKRRTQWGIEDLNKARTNTYRALRNQVHGLTFSITPEISDAAYDVEDVFLKYRNLGQQNYKKKSAMIFNLIEELETTFSAEMDTLGLTEQLNQLKDQNADFNTYFVDRDAERRRFATGEEIKATRQQLTDAYRRLTDYFEAFAETGVFTGEANDIVNPINEAINRWKTVIARRQALNGKTEEESDSNDQPTTPPSDPTPTPDPADEGDNTGDFGDENTPSANA